MTASRNKKDIRKLVDQLTLRTGGDAKVADRITAVNTLLNGGYHLELLYDEPKELEKLWESLFFALWHAEMGRGFEELTTVIIRGCYSFPRLIQTGFNVISSKWYGLDQFRIDKISHLTRHLLHALIEYQVIQCLKSFKRSKRVGGSLRCKPVTLKTLQIVKPSKGLCEFMLELFAEETRKVLCKVYIDHNLVIGHETQKAKLIIFIYKQLISFNASQNTLESRIVRIFDLYVFKHLFTHILQNESQVCQILVTLRLKEALAKKVSKSDQALATNCRKLFTRWSMIISEIHENCINSVYFPHSKLPILQNIETNIV